MKNLPVDPKLKPSAEQMQRAAIADLLFEYHSVVNQVVGHTALAIAEDAPIRLALELMQEKIDTALRITMKAAYLKAGLTL